MVDQRTSGNSKDLHKYNMGHTFKKNYASPVGLEPTTSGLEVRRAIHCATETRLLSTSETFVQLIAVCDMYGIRLIFLHWLYRYYLDLKANFVRK